MEEIKTSAELRRILGQQIIKLQNGDITPAYANSIANAAQKMISEVKIEMEYAKMVWNYVGFRLFNWT